MAGSFPAKPDKNSRLSARLGGMTGSSCILGATFDNSYARELPGCYVEWPPVVVPQPRLLFFNHDLADELGLELGGHDEASLAAVFSGNGLPEGAVPLAQAYAGHQFGQFSPQLGDGRALLLGEVIDRLGRRRDLAFKGSGPTPFARRGDGKAALGPMLREALLGEAMHALGVPTTRALAVVGTGEAVQREKALPGAVLTRVAASHLRVGSFEYLAARGEIEKLRRLADYTLRRHHPDQLDAPDRYLALLQASVQQQAGLVAQWMNLGFIHGVMNTDNMSLAGETLDYGPCAFMETFDPDAVFSSIDVHGRYAYARQPGIAQWNLARLAEALLPLWSGRQDEALARASAALDKFAVAYRQHRLTSLRVKLGLRSAIQDGDRIDAALADDWLGLLQTRRVDFTLAWRALADAADGRPDPLLALCGNTVETSVWLARWQARCAEESGMTNGPERARAMRRVNPRIIPRNHRVEEALTAASDEGDLGPFRALLAALRQPCDESPERRRFAEPAPQGFTTTYRTYCGT